MTVMALPDTAPPEWATAPVDNDGNDPVIHLSCCDPEIALCGEPLHDAEDVAADDPCPPCATCDRINELELSCGAPFCRVRRWWRDRRSS